MSAIMLHPQHSPKCQFQEVNLVSPLAAISSLNLDTPHEPHSTCSHPLCHRMVQFSPLEFDGKSIAEKQVDIAPQLPRQPICSMPQSARQYPRLQLAATRARRVFKSPILLRLLLRIPELRDMLHHIAMRRARRCFCFCCRKVLLRHAKKLECTKQKLADIALKLCYRINALLLSSHWAASK